MNLIFIEDLQHIVQYGDNDLGLKACICHVVAFVRTHDGRTKLVSRYPYGKGRETYAQQIPRLLVLMRLTSDAWSTRRRCSINALSVA